MANRLSTGTKTTAKQRRLNTAKRVLENPNCFGKDHRSDRCIDSILEAEAIVDETATWQTGATISPKKLGLAFKNIETARWRLAYAEEIHQI